MKIRVGGHVFDTNDAELVWAGEEKLYGDHDGPLGYQKVEIYQKGDIVVEVYHTRDRAMNGFLDLFRERYEPVEVYGIQRSSLAACHNLPDELRPEL